MSDAVKPIGEVTAVKGSLGDLTVITWRGEQPPIGTLLYAAPPAPISLSVLTSDPIAWAEVYDEKIVAVQLDKSKWHTTPLYLSAPAEQTTGLNDLIEKSKAKLAAMSEEERQAMWQAQRESFVRAMTTPCEHGALDFEQCPQCRSPAPAEQVMGSVEMPETPPHEALKAVAWPKVEPASRTFEDTKGEVEIVGYVRAEEIYRAFRTALAFEPQAQAATDNRHSFVPNKKYPWFCAHCGYAPHELLKHFPPAALSAEVEG